MKRNLFLTLLFITFSSLLANAAVVEEVVPEDKSVIKGTITDAKTGEPLIGVSVFVPGTSIGSSTDLDGNFIIEVEPGNYTIQMTFIGYLDVTIPNLIAKKGSAIEIEQKMTEDSQMLGEVKVVGTARRESQQALIAEQKNATVIRESIGADQLSAQGVSDAAAATSKISGVSKTEGAGDVFVRGLGDRYLSTTMNGLPIPSDDVDKKNINLSIFGTNVIQNVSISKTYDASNYIDQSSGNIDILSKAFKGDFTVSASAGFNGSVLKDDVWDNFKGTANHSDITLGYFSQPYPIGQAMTKQSWNPTIISTPLDRKIGTTGGFRLGKNEDFSVFYTVSYGNSFQHSKGVYRKFRSNIKKREFLDVESFSNKYNLTGLLNLKYNLPGRNTLVFNTLYVNKTSDNFYEQGRNMKGYGYDIEDVENSYFTRDQNTKTIGLLVNQLIGTHWITDNNNLKWAVGYNMVSADEPNRIRNSTGFSSQGTMIFPAAIGDYGNGKSSQEIADDEVNAYINDEISLPSLGESHSVKFGVNFRQKKRDFESNFYGAAITGMEASSVDNLDEVFLDGGLKDSDIKTLPIDTYDAELTIYGVYLNYNFKFGKLGGTVGGRFEKQEITLDWNVGNYYNRETGQTRIGDLSRDNSSFYPAINLKYDLKDNMFLRLAASKTITVPEFKEMAPFEYMAPTGRVIKGNEKLINSDNYNVDLKWEYYPSPDQLFSFTTFYKRIENPINSRAPKGGSEAYYFENTGDVATVYGLEVEGKFNVIKTDDHKLSFVLNATQMWNEQDLFEEFYYKDKTTAGLQGASDFILNALGNYELIKSNLKIATSVNYSSDKIYSLGAPTDGEDRATIYDDDIIEEGFWSLDFVCSKKITDKLSFKLTAKNILNPEIRRTQDVMDFDGNETTEVVRSYKKGYKISLGVKYVF